jgi:hypothetical protein
VTFLLAIRFLFSFRTSAGEIARACLSPISPCTIQIGHFRLQFLATTYKQAHEH